MSSKDTNRNAHATFIAMAKGVHASKAAQTALCAVKWYFGLGKLNQSRHENNKKKKRGIQEEIACHFNIQKTSRDCKDYNDILQRVPDS